MSAGAYTLGEAFSVAVPRRTGRPVSHADRIDLPASSVLLREDGERRRRPTRELLERVVGRGGVPRLVDRAQLHHRVRHPRGSAEVEHRLARSRLGDVHVLYLPTDTHQSLVEAQGAAPRASPGADRDGERQISGGAS
jgi:hypothetical protein